MRFVDKYEEEGQENLELCTMKFIKRRDA